MYGYIHTRIFLRESENGGIILRFLVNLVSFEFLAGWEWKGGVLGMYIYYVPGSRENRFSQTLIFRENHARTVTVKRHVQINRRYNWLISILYTVVCVHCFCVQMVYVCILYYINLLNCVNNYFQFTLSYFCTYVSRMYEYYEKLYFSTGVRVMRPRLYVSQRENLR